MNPLIAIKKKYAEIVPVVDTYMTLFADDFSTNDADWQATGWTYSAGKWTSAATNSSNNLFLNRVYNVNKRYAKFTIKPSSDTEIRIHLKSGQAGNTGEGASLFGIDFWGTGFMRIFKVANPYDGNPNVTSNGVNELEALISAPCVPYVAGHEYECKLEYLETKHIFTCKDLTTNQTSSIEFDGWAAGRQQQSYSFFVMGGGACELHSFEVKAISDIDTLIVGDSITEGVMVIDKSQRWWKLLEPQISGIIATSARGGHTVADVVSKFDNEIALLNPKNIIFTIGINNNGIPASDYTALLNKCLNAGINPIFNYLTCYNNGQHIPAQNSMLSVIPPQYLGMRFDIATSIDGGGVNYDPALFYDGLHPIEAGCVKMAERFAIDNLILM